MARLNNKVALITGAAQGIGQAIAEVFVKEGAQVILSDVKEQLGLDVAKKLGSTASFQYLNVQDESSWQTVMDNINKQYGKLDILVNNAGIMTEHGQPQDPEHVSLESWRHIHAVNLDGVFLGCKHAIAMMKKHGGVIVNMSSRSGIVGIPNAAAYASSKAAIRNHTKTVAIYCAQQGYNIRCNSIHPAAILTPLWNEALGQGEAKAIAIANLSKGIPLQHMGEPLDVAYAALYMASDESKYMTGAELTLDGGILAGSAAAPGKAK